MGTLITLVANVGRNTVTPSEYQWFKFIDGINDLPLNTKGTNGHTYVISSPSTLDIGKYYYTIHNSDQYHTGSYGYGLEYVLSLTSHVQTIKQQETPPTSKTYSICEYDENNPSLNRFTYTVDWNQQIVECMSRQAKADSVLTEMAIEKLMDQRVSAYYNQYATQCLSKTKEKMTYIYLSKEYHYTLYYYDQGANLVQTVPPQGVNPLSIEQTKVFVRGVSADPAHTLITRYKYNSLNQLESQTTPDAGESNFLYNNKGQLRLSQNAQQQQGNVYSYTKYDEQGRILEVGETSILIPINNPILIDSIHTTQFPSPNAYTLTDVTKTHYDFADTTSGNSFTQDYLRSRVAWVEVIDKEATDTVKTHYSYDLHGNVKSLQQSVPGLKSKRTDYVYDLVSGKVNYVMYQYGEQDQFIHQYDYDADNRIRLVHTSSDGYVWNKEADYDYYLHGPLSRTELGHYRVQGLDYHYTLQGWIKGVNMPYAGDPGADGLNGNKTGKDVFAYTLGYFSGDYEPVNSTALNVNRDHVWDRALENIQHSGLYNGNISWMETDLPTIGAKQNDRTKGMQAMLYRYDQLHRITQSRSLTNYSEASGFAMRNVTSAYDEDYSYDANGNILTLKRNDELSTLKDDFVYDYYAGTNKLKNVKTTQTQNYSYDAIGNLINDAEEGVTINWTPYGKVRNVQKGDSVTTSYRYDASGNRVEMKTVKTDTTFITRYLRDASGNVMSIYKDTVASELPIYGSSRLGQYKGGVVEGHRTLGHRSYELSNHLGNVLAVITDNVSMNQDSIAATVLNTSDYYPFGLDMKGRSYIDTTANVYRYGFNGKEKDNMGSSVYDYGFRIYNPRIGKFLSVDPLTKSYPELTPYQFASNSPIISIDIDGLEAKDAIYWEDLIQRKITKSTANELKNRADHTPFNGPFNKWSIQGIEHAQGQKINLDYFSVSITSLPKIGGKNVSAPQFLDYIRQNINEFVDGSTGNFKPYSRKDEKTWASQDPTNSVISIDMGDGRGLASFNPFTNPDDGSVIVSNVSSNSWTFTTIQSPNDFQHPVSGNRQFGYIGQSDGSFTFYTKGADRLTGRIDSWLGDYALGQGEKLWQGFQDRLTNFVNTHDGSAKKNAPVVWQPDYSEIENKEKK